MRLHLEGCGECRTEYVELRGVQVLLKSVPVVAPPRAFTLTEEMVGHKEKGGFWQRILAPRNAPRFATGSVLAFVLLALVVVGDFAGGSTMESFAPYAASEAPERSSKAAPPAVSNAQEAEGGVGATGGAGGASETATDAGNAVPSPVHAEATTGAALYAGSAMAEATAATGATALEAAPPPGQPDNIAPSPPASTPAPEITQVTASDAQPTDGATASGVSSPSTLAMEENNDTPQGNDLDRAVLPVAERQSGSASLLLGLEVALALLAVLFGVGALVARRRR